MSQKLTMTEAGTGKPITHTVSNMIGLMPRIAAIEDFGIYRSRHNGPVTADSKNELFDPLWFNRSFGCRTISIIRLRQPDKTIFVLHSPEEIKKAIAGNVRSLHMNDALLATYESVLRQVEKTTKMPYVVARFGLLEAVPPEHPNFITLARTIPQIRNALAAKKPLGLINPVSDLRTFSRPKATRHFDIILKPTAL